MIRPSTSLPASLYFRSTIPPAATPLYPSTTPAQAATDVLYREYLNENWGIADVADEASCVKYLASTALIDLTCVGVVGSSAGEYATLQSLCVYPDIWAGGVSEYGISDMSMLEKVTHKFESHYIRGLLLRKEAGEVEREIVYRERSPPSHAESIRAPLLLLQGAEDPVVPPKQASEMEKVIMERGGDVRLGFLRARDMGLHGQRL